MAFSKFFNSVEPLFKKDGKYEKFYPFLKWLKPYSIQVTQ